MRGTMREVDLSSTDLEELAEKLREGSAWWHDGPMESPCLLWLGGIDGPGYGMIKFKGRRWACHRIGYLLSNGAPAKQNVLHKCDEPRCWAPLHLWEGSQQENVADAIAKGRMNKVGEHNPIAKLKATDVIKIRELLAEGLSQRKIARLYSVTQSAIGDISTGKRWAWLNEEETAVA